MYTIRTAKGKPLVLHCVQYSIVQ